MWGVALVGLGCKGLLRVEGALIGRLFFVCVLCFLSRPTKVPGGGTSRTMCCVLILNEALLLASETEPVGPALAGRKEEVERRSFSCVT